MPSFGELDILNYQVMTKTVGEFQHPNLVLTARFPDEIIDGIQARWDVLKPSRQKAGFRVPNQAASKLDLMSVDTKSATCLLMNLEKALDEGALGWLREPGTAEQNNARALITREQADLEARIAYTVEWAVSQALSGSLTVSVGGVNRTIDYGIDATHKPTASASWATATTDIPDDVGAWAELIEKDSGYASADAYVNRNTMAYIIKNTKVQNLLGQGTVREQVAETGHITHFMGLDWHVYNAGYIDANGDFQRFIPDDKVVILPRENAFGRLQLGSQMIPAGGSNDLVKVFGAFSYAVVQTNPPGVNLYVGKNFLPVLTLPDAVVYADVTP
ncbi:MAG: major capsid protein [Planctomycetota bacterium]